MASSIERQIDNVAVEVPVEIPFVETIGAVLRNGYGPVVKLAERQ